jgi:Asp-tRNA(Asn)/Glu-tRNA(Gln) amidotransferase C subunit
MVDEGKVRKEAKQIIDKFAKTLEKIKMEDLDFYVDKDDFERIEGDGEECDFKTELLENAPEKNQDFVIAEKGAWKK